MSLSCVSELALLPEEEIEKAVSGLSEEKAKSLLWDWRFIARPEQMAPEGDWLTWVIDAGRGFGKTRAGAEWVREQVNAGRQRIALVAETYKDLVEVMCYGDSGIEAVFPPHQKPKIVANPNVQITFHTGAIALGYNATQPQQLRGPQFDAAWCDELAKWRYARETWDMLQFGLRLGDHPQVLVTTTPRPIPVLREILADPTTVVTRGSTFDNAANLAKPFLSKIRSRYEGTRLGRQELFAEMLDDLPGALWTREMIDRHRVKEHPQMQRVVVAVDPSGTGGDEDDGDSIGIVVAGKGVDGRGYVLEDMTIKASPGEWAKAAVDAYHKFEADRLVAETNFGGAMVKHAIQTVDPTVSFKEVKASRGKVIRAEPIAALYEQGRISHVGTFPELEDQMCDFGADGYIGDGSPDRADALVWALTEIQWGGDTVFDTPFDSIAEAPFPIPAHWARAYAVETRKGRAAVLWGAIDPSDGVVHLYGEHEMPAVSTSVSVASVKARGDWISGVFPLTAAGRSLADGKALAREMKAAGLRVQGVAIPEDVSAMQEAVRTGRIKVFSTLQGFEREYRTFRREDNGTLSEPGLLMSAFRAFMVAGRKVARTKPIETLATSQRRVADARAGY